MREMKGFLMVTKRRKVEGSEKWEMKCSDVR